MTGPDRPLGLALILLGALAGGAALLIGDQWGPRTVPLLAAGTMAAAGLALLRAAPAGPARADAPFDDAPVGPVALLLALAVLYVLGIDRVGYLVATALAAPAAFALFGMRRPLPLAVAALAAPLLLHLAFFRVLGVFPPLGAWFDLLDWVPL